MHPKYLREFLNKLEFALLRSLKRKGNSIKRGNFPLSHQAERFLTKKFNLSKKMDKTNILDFFGLEKSIIKLQ